MPDKDGKLKGISVPAVPWCLTCRWTKCRCAQQRYSRITKRGT